jgi:hypothetical protein
MNISTSFSPSKSSIGTTPSRDASRRPSAVKVPVVIMIPLSARPDIGRSDGELSVGGLRTALEVERSSPDALLHMIARRTVSSRSGAYENGSSASKIAARTGTIALRSTYTTQQHTQGWSFRNRQASASSPLVGSTLSNYLRCSFLYPQCIVTWFVK